MACVLLTLSLLPGATMSSIVPPSEDSSTTTYSGSDQSEKPIHAYVDFSEYYRNVELARRAGNLPPILLDSIWTWHFESTFLLSVSAMWTWKKLFISFINFRLEWINLHLYKFLPDKPKFFLDVFMVFFC